MDKLERGQQIGNYRLITLLGQGDFGQVYLGEHLYLDAPTGGGKTMAAIKLFPSVQKVHQVSSFLKRSQMLAALNHPHIDPVLDFGIEEGLPYLVMEYVPGGSIRQYYPAGTRMPLDTILTYVQQIGEALQYAHERHMIHRDLKPENILVGAKGELLLTDFGISTLIDENRQRSRTQPQHNQDVTIAYMAPEQMAGHPCYASDQYALGVVAYEWLTGQLPSRAQLMQASGRLNRSRSLDAPSAPSELNPAIPPAIDQAILKALSTHPEERFADVATFLAALQITDMRRIDEEHIYPISWYKERFEEQEQAWRTQEMKARGKQDEEKDETALLLRHVVQPAVQEALGALSWLERSCVLLSVDAKFTLAEMAVILDLEEREVQSCLERGKQRLLSTYRVKLEQKHAFRPEALSLVGSEQHHLEYLLACLK